MQLRLKPAIFSFIIAAALAEAGAVASEGSWDRVDKRDPGFSSRGEVLYLGKQPFTGIQFESFPNGSLYRETHYQNGKKDGVEKNYSLSGSLRDLWNYKNGKKEGVQKGWFEDDSKRFVYHYKNAKLEGEQIEWHQNGTVFRRQVFHDGYEIDKKILFQRGAIFTNYVKRDGRVYGIDGGALCFDKKKDGER
jgi:hypothetical protein